MTTCHAESDVAPRRRGVAGRGLMSGLLLGLVMAVLAVVTANLAGLLPAGSEAYAWLGVGVAFAAALAATAAHFALLRSAPTVRDGRVQAMRVQSLLGLSLLAKLVGLCVGLGVLVTADVKFHGVAAFAIAFAAASLLIQLCVAWSMVRRVSAPTLVAADKVLGPSS